MTKIDLLFRKCKCVRTHFVFLFETSTATPLVPGRPAGVGPAASAAVGTGTEPTWNRYGAEPDAVYADARRSAGAARKRCEKKSVFYANYFPAEPRTHRNTHRTHRTHRTHPAGRQKNGARKRFARNAKTAPLRKDAVRKLRTEGTSIAKKSRSAGNADGEATTFCRATCRSRKK